MSVCKDECAYIEQFCEIRPESFSVESVDVENRTVTFSFEAFDGTENADKKFTLKSFFSCSFDEDEEGEYVDDVFLSADVADLLTKTILPFGESAFRFVEEEITAEVEAAIESVQEEKEIEQ